MTLLWIIDCLVVSLAVTFIMGMAWLCIVSLLLGFYNYYEHCVDLNHRMMDRFSRTTNYPMYEKYQERCTVAAARLRKVEKLLHVVTFY